VMPNEPVLHRMAAAEPTNETPSRAYQQRLSAERLDERLEAAGPTHADFDKKPLASRLKKRT